jgi:phytoene dehydrogenase-like protein
MVSGSNTFDVVFVGAGHNALIAACYLAKAGRSVCLLDQRPAPGGWVHSEELTVPGFIHDAYSALHPIFVNGPVFAELGTELAEYGLRYVQGSVSTVHRSEPASTWTPSSPAAVAPPVCAPTTGNTSLRRGP